MSGLKNLIEKILLDANEKARGVIDAGKTEAAGIVAGYEKKAESEKKDLLAKAAVESAARKAQLVSSAELEIRDKKLAAKQQMIDKVFAAAIEKLNAMNETQYASFLSTQLGGMAFAEDTEIVVPERFQNVDLAKINPRLRLNKSGKTIANGFLLLGKGSESNNTFEALLDYHRDELEKLIVTELFGA